MLVDSKFKFSLNKLRLY